MSMRRERPTQREIIPSNPVEAAYLQQSQVYGQSQNVFIDQLKMQSAYGDLREDEIKELIWPSIEVKVEKQVQYVLPGSKEISTDTVTRVSRRPMTWAETAEHFYNQAIELRARAGIVDIPTGSKKTAKPKTKSKSKPKEKA